MTYLLCLGLFSPFLGFLSLTFFSSFWKRQGVGLLACLTIFISFLAFLTLFVIDHREGLLPFSLTLFQWLPIDGLQADFKLHLDPLSLWMTLIVTGVGLLIHVYSMGYMEHEEDVGRYFACLNLFVFSMLLLVLAGHLLVLFVGWEGVGLASYLLIGFWYHKPSAAQAAVKAFVVNRIGDLGLLFGIILTFYLFETGDIQEIVQKAQIQFDVGMPIITLLTCLFFIGAIGKSAQLPLHTWLPDAMEGPTPVSALIHAATMVTAGVYLIVRLHSLFLLAPFTLELVGIVGGVGSLFASLCALGQTDLKRVLAYSTMSQLGLMFLACGAGAFYSAMFHLTSHAFIKALLFLSAGNVLHRIHDITDMQKMGGLGKVLPITQGLFFIGLLALSGIPFFAGFFSKDLILEQEAISHHTVLFYLGLLASILTGVYLTRAFYLTFKGDTHLSANAFSSIQEAPKIMWIPAAILAVFSTLGGLLGLPVKGVPLLQGYLKQLGLTPAEAELKSGYHFTVETGIAVTGAILGVAITAWIYHTYSSKLGKPFPLFQKSFYVDEIYDKWIVAPLHLFSKWITQFFEPHVFEGVIGGTLGAFQFLSKGTQKLQSGQIRSYFAWMVLGSVFLIVYLVM